MTQTALRWMARCCLAITCSISLQFQAAQSAELRAWRTSFSGEKTRLVFELDQPADYQISADSQFVRISFEGLNLPDHLLAQIQRSRGGLLKGVQQMMAGSRMSLQFEVRQPFRHEALVLERPDRIVLDFFPAPIPLKENPAAAKPDTASRSSSLASGDNQQIQKLQPSETETVTHAGPPLESNRRQSPAASGASGYGGFWIFFVPLAILILGLIAFYAVRKSAGRKKRAEGRGYFSELDSERIDFQTLMQREDENRTAKPDQNASSRAAASALTELAPYIRERGSIRQQAHDGDAANIPSQGPVGNVGAELNIEEASLTWPLYLRDDGRAGRVMVLDDEKEICTLLQDYLTVAGFEVQAFTDSQEALGKFDEWRPDLLVLDVVMPGLSGLDFALAMRKNEPQLKVIFLSGRSERETVAETFEEELDSGQYEFFKKPLFLQQIGGRIRDYFSAAQDLLRLNLLNPKEFAQGLEPLSPQQLAALHGFIWDRVFETSAELLDRRIEPVYITDRMEPASNYMRRMGCPERKDYCIAKVCIVSNPTCASKRLRAEIEVMRQILLEFREEHLMRRQRSAGSGEPSLPRRSRRRDGGREMAEAISSVHRGPAEKSLAPPPRKPLRRLVQERKR